MNDTIRIRNTENGQVIRLEDPRCLRDAITGDHAGWLDGGRFYRTDKFIQVPTLHTENVTEECSIHENADGDILVTHQDYTYNMLILPDFIKSKGFSLEQVEAYVIPEGFNDDINQCCQDWMNHMEGKCKQSFIRITQTKEQGA